jgi:threonine/homoserine/homoserine lactone efflux protein
MDIAFCAKGIAVGFVLCAPLGPVGVLCLERTVSAGRLAGFCSILGAAVVDGFYGLVAGLGMNAVETFLNEGRFWFQIFGGVVLVAVGLRLYMASPASGPSRTPGRSRLDAFLATAALMLSNPFPILVISAALSAVTAGRPGSAFADIPLFALGLFLGSLLWSPLLVGASSWIRRMIQPNHLRLIHRICGAVIAGCGLVLGAASLAAGRL